MFHTQTANYAYDAIYRLIAADGREQIGQVTTPQPAWDDKFRVNLPHPNEGQAMRRYVEEYEYDAVGNIEQIIHHLGNLSKSNTSFGQVVWKRTYVYDEPSATPRNNRLTSTAVGATKARTIQERYTYDEHGNMTAMPHLAKMDWDFKDQLRQIDLDGGGTAYYIYDVAGQRVRKVIERQNGTRQKERIYLGGFEVYREYDGNESKVTLERETLHIMDIHQEYDGDDREVTLERKTGSTINVQQPIALVETRTQGKDSSLVQLIRYPFGNHLGSAVLELDGIADIISYEEYYPYGSTSYQAVYSHIETPKRYRYTAKERDEESGLYYYGARYYASWLARWIAPDPIGIKDGLNTYTYVKGRPTINVDQQGAYGELSPLSSGGVITTTHEDLKKEAAKYKASGMKFGFSDVAKWTTDPEYLTKFKENFVFENRLVIKAAAAKYDLPPELLAGIVYNEIGGKDPIKPGVYQFRRFVPFTDDKDKTSLGQQATQVRRAAEALGYDLKKLTDAQRDEILATLNDPSQSIFLAAKHLSDLRNIDFSGKAEKDLTQADIQVIGARYNRGPDLSLTDVKKNLSYGIAITKRWYTLGSLLTSAPAPLEYSPFSNNVLKPLGKIEGYLEWNIKKLYGVPF